MIARLALAGMLLGSSAVADQAAFAAAFDICTDHAPRLTERAEALASLGWQPTRGSHLPDLLATAATGSSAVWTHAPGEMITHGATFSAWVLEGYRDDPGLVQVFQPAAGIEPPLIVVLRERQDVRDTEKLDHLTSDCVIATNFAAPVPPLLAGFSPDTAPAGLAPYFEKLYAPLQSTGGDGFTSVLEIKATFATAPTTRGILTVDPFALVEVTASIIPDEDLEIYKSALTPDPRYAQ